MNTQAFETVQSATVSEPVKPETRAQVVARCTVNGAEAARAADAQLDEDTLYSEAFESATKTLKSARRALVKAHLIASGAIAARR